MSKNIDIIVNRFLGWKLPKDFAPDGGISFKPNEHPDFWPVGTHLNGADPDSFPDNQKDKDGWVGALVIKPDGRILKYDRCPHPYDLSQNRFVCLGSGRDFAYGAMEMGADAVRAVEVACKYEASCGCGIETMTLGGIYMHKIRRN